MIFVPDSAETLQHPHARASRSRDAHSDAAARPHLQKWDELGVIVGSALYLWISRFTLRGVPFLLGGDQVYFWLYSQRMLDGELPYRDFLQFTPPGTNLIFAAALRILGQHIWVTNLVALLLGVALAWICFRVGRAFLTRWQAALAAALFLILIYGKLMIATNHWFSLLAVLAASGVLMRQRTLPRIAAAGILLGIATFFTQTRGPAAFIGLALYLLRERTQTGQSWRKCCKRLAILCGSMTISWAILVAYFAAQAGPGQMFYWLVTYLARYHSSTASGLGLPEEFAWRHATSYIQVLAIYLMLPAVYGVSLISLWKRKPREPYDAERMLLTLAGLAMMLEVAMSPNWLRVYGAAAPAVLLLIWAAGRLGRLRNPAAWSLCLLLICVVCWSALSRRHEQGALVQLPAGEAMTTKAQAAKLAWIAAHTTPGEYFFQAAWPAVYLPLLLRHPAFVDAFLPADETRPELVARTITQLDSKQVPYILWSPRLDTPMLPAHPETYHLAPFRDYLQSHYRRVMVFSDRDEIWERR